MPTCFVIQPFNPTFDKRYNDTYKPALEEAGLEPYRVDQDLSTEGIIVSIEDEIRKATICLADITSNNPNVWYELGYAFAVGRSVIMVCSNERKGYPFDIQHRAIIQYASESASDFERLRDDITKRAKALVKKNAARQVIETEQVAPTGGLRQAEIKVLAIAAAETTLPGDSIGAWSLRHDAMATDLTGIGFSVAIRGLERKGFVQFEHFLNDNGETYHTVAVTDTAWAWIDSNDSLFSLFKGRKTEDDVELTEDDIPF